MLKRIFVSFLAYLMAFYPMLGYTATKGEVEVSSPLAGEGKGEGDLNESTKVKLQETYGKLPLYFIQNNGQVDEKVKFYEKGSGHATFFTKEGVYLSLHKEAEVNKSVMEQGNRVAVNDRGEGVSSDNDAQPAIIKLKPIGANKDPEIIAENKQEGKVNYFIGNDPNKWKTNIPTYQAVVYKEIYKGVDMKFYGNNQQMEYDIIVKPGADPKMVKFSYEGVEGLKVTQEGDLEITLHSSSPLVGEGNGEGAKLIQKKPYIYQEIDGKRVEVDGEFKILNLTPDPRSLNPIFSYGFQVASYNKSYPLVMDPVLAYSTYLGGRYGDNGYGIAVDTSGNAYITGWTSSADFPTSSPIQGSKAGNEDAFVAKINSSGTALIYSTYLGGSGGDWGNDIAVDTSGNAYITGLTYSTNFPTSLPIEGSNAGDADAFVAKINSSGTALIYSTYLGGSGGDWGNDIAVDTSGNAYLTGRTDSTTFPTASAIQGSYAGGGDAFVTKINSSGTALVYSTYLGGSGGDWGNDIAVDTSGNAYITGGTVSTNFPTVSAIQGSYVGNYDAFATKINSSGTALIYSTYLGGSGEDVGFGIAIDTSRNAYITGYTASTNFPTASAIQGSNAGGSDVFVTKINEPGSSLVYSTYLGGSSSDGGYRIGIAVDPSGNAYITGLTYSTNFPMVSPIQGANAGSYDAFVAKINSSGTALVYSTYMGGSNQDEGFRIAVDPLGNAYITGRTYSTDFPLASPIYGSNAGSWDALVTKISPVISGCIQLGGSPVSGASVILKQKRVADQTTTTNTSGCYHFDTAVSGKTFQVIITGPTVP